jgi:hypothetical protein
MRPIATAELGPCWNPDQRAVGAGGIEDAVPADRATVPGAQRPAAAVGVDQAGAAVGVGVEVGEDRLLHRAVRAGRRDVVEGEAAERVAVDRRHARGSVRGQERDDQFGVERAVGADPIDIDRGLVEVVGAEWPDASRAWGGTEDRRRIGERDHDELRDPVGLDHTAELELGDLEQTQEVERRSIVGKDR